MATLRDGAESAEGFLDFVRDVAEFLDTAESYMGQKSLIDVSKHFRVEPLLVVDQSTLSLDYIDDVCWGVQGTFAGYYLQAVEAQTNIDGVKVAEKLAPLNPNRKVDLTMLSYQDSVMSSHGYDFRLPLHEHYQFSADRVEQLYRGNYSIEADGPKPPKQPPMEHGGGVSSNKDDNLKLMDADGLSVGRLYDVTVKGKTQQATVKVAIRVISKIVPQNTCELLFASTNVLDHDMKYRLMGVLSGRLSFFRDLVLCNDIVDMHRNASIKDKTGVYDEFIARKNSGTIAGLLERNPSLATASNLAIISKETARQLELKHMDKLSNPKVRQALFGPSSLMILAIVDPDYDHVTFYHRGISQGSTVSIRDLQKSNRNGGPNPADMMKAFLQGHAPSL